jgi:hypothetical protein
MIEIKSEEHMYKKEHFNKLTMIFQKYSLKKHDIILKYEAVMLCFQNIKTRQ